MLRATIIEDEYHSAELLEQMLLEIEPSVEIVEKCADLPSGIRSIKKYSPDIVFLDIELPIYSGIQLLDFFDPAEINFNIIFTTAYNEYAVRAFEMSAVDYLMKPIQEEKLKISIEKVLNKQGAANIEILPILKRNFQQHNKKLVVPVADGFEILRLDDIYYLKAEGSYTKIYFDGNASLLVSKNLKHFEFIFSGIENFVRVHRSFIANINFVKKIVRRDGATLFLENRSEVPVAEDKIEKVLELLHKL